MNDTTFIYKDTCGITQQEIAQVSTQLLPEVERISRIRNTGYNSDYASINAPLDHLTITLVQEVINQKKKLKPSMLIVIGIGGSSLGTAAVHQALYGSLPNHQAEMLIFYADTIDPDYIQPLIIRMEQELRADNIVLLNVVSKSGNTTETIVNFEIFLNLLKQYKKNTYNEYVVVTSDQDSLLWRLAVQEHFTCLEIPKKIGGRYSVFSPVGLFPLGMTGVDIHALCAGASQALANALDTDITHNIPALSAIILYLQYKKGRTIHDTFLFSADLAGFGAWYRQLMAESIGKEFDNTGKRVTIDMTPTTTIGPNDLHSVAQLYLAGAQTTITTFISVAKNKSDIMVPVIPAFEPLVANVQGKSLSSILNAIEQGVRQTYQERDKPFIQITLAEKKPVYIGQLLQYKMMEIMYLGFLLEINPFDQPQVELYKNKTGKILAHE